METTECMRRIREEHARRIWRKKEKGLQPFYTADVRDGYHPNSEQVLVVAQDTTKANKSQSETNSEKKSKKINSGQNTFSQKIHKGHRSDTTQKSSKPHKEINMTEVMCFTCRKSGHFSSSCPHKAKYESFLKGLEEENQSNDKAMAVTDHAF
jgi:hypothetical protein